MSDPIIAPAAIEAKKFEFKRPGYLITLTITPDTVECRCSYKPNPAGAPMAYNDLQNYLNQAKVAEGIDDEAISTLLTSATSNKTVTDLLIARGIPMIPGEDGRLHLSVEDSMLAPSSETKSDNDNMDLRVVQQFFNVVPDEIIAQVIPPGAGVPGKSIHGTVIPAQPGKLLIPVLGPNVHLSECGDLIYADSEGRVAINGAEISVENIYLVKGNVDFKVGNIVFNGFVEIKGDVLDEFSVKATKGIKVQGNIGLCTIESAGDITFCGMSGQGKGVIRSGGNITANFINDVTVECDGDINVEYEIRNCHIDCLGSIKINKGVLAGGDYVALGGIESSAIGTVTSQRTHVAAGVHYRDQLELARLFNELKELISHYTNNRANSDMKEFAAKRAEITEQVQQIRTRVYPGRNPKINVKKTLYEMVNITLGIISEDNREERKGPLSIIENSVEGGFRFLNMTDLSVRAEEIERAFVQQYELQKTSMGGKS
jgi:uncharacterized protein (DUF342 family)